MENDFRREFDQLRPKVRKQWIILFILAVGFLPFNILINSFLNPTIVIGKFITWGYILLFSCVSFFWLLRIKCPNCNKSLYVYKYIWKIPIIVQGMITDHCQHCGVWLKGEK